MPNFRGNEDLGRLGKEYLNDLLCKFSPFCLQHSKTFDILHAFLRVTIAELSTLKQVRFFWPTLYIASWVTEGTSGLCSFALHFNQALTIAFHFICISLHDYTITNFYARKLLLLSACLSHRNSVRLSVRHTGGESKMVQGRITKSSPFAAWKTLVLGTAKLFYKFEGGSPRTRALNERGWEKLTIFSQ